MQYYYTANSHSVLSPRCHLPSIWLSWETCTTIRRASICKMLAEQCSSYGHISATSWSFRPSNLYYHNHKSTQGLAENIEFFQIMQMIHQRCHWHFQVVSALDHLKTNLNIIHRGKDTGDCPGPVWEASTLCFLWLDPIYVMWHDNKLFTLSTAVHLWHHEVVESCNVITFFHQM